MFLFYVEDYRPALTAVVSPVHNVYRILVRITRTLVKLLVADCQALLPQ